MDKPFFKVYSGEKSRERRVSVEIKKETVCEDTLYILREYYHLNTEPLFSVLADDCGSDQSAVQKRIYYACL